MSTPPRWDMSDVYPSLESKEFQAAVKNYKAQVASLGRFFDAKLMKAGPKTPVAQLAALTGEAIDRVNKIQILSGNRPEGPLRSPGTIRHVRHRTEDPIVRLLHYHSR